MFREFINIWLGRSKIVFMNCSFFCVFKKCCISAFLFLSFLDHTHIQLHVKVHHNSSNVFHTRMLISEIRLSITITVSSVIRLYIHIILQKESQQLKTIHSSQLSCLMALQIEVRDKSHTHMNE